MWKNVSNNDYMFLIYLGTSEMRFYVPRWGVGTTLGCLMSSKITGFFGGSSVNTSRAAPPHCPDFNEFNKASSSTMPPRATLTM